MGIDIEAKNKSVSALSAIKLSEQITEASIRLVECFSKHDDIKILGLQIKREIIYRFLTGERGDILHSLISSNNHFDQIEKMLSEKHR